MGARRVLVVQHVEPEAPYAVADALDAAAVGWEVVRTDRGGRLPAQAGGLAGIVVMGGPMAVYDDGFSTGEAERALLTDALSRRLPVLGVCLGAQLLAAAGGAAVYPGDGPEVGWGPIELTEAARVDRLFGDLPETFTVLHWHGDTFDIPPRAVHLARSARYEQQAFRIGSRAWGIQFHLEVELDAVERLAKAFPDQARQCPDGAEGLLEQAPAALEALLPLRQRVLAAFADVVSEGSHAGA